jgi:hypothetical protein
MGSLRVVGGSWYGPDGRRVKRKIGPARTPGERDGLTRPQAEKEVRRIRDAEAAGAVSLRAGGFMRPTRHGPVSC